MDISIINVPSDSENEIEDEDNRHNVELVDRINSFSQINITDTVSSHVRDVQSRPAEIQANCYTEQNVVRETDPLFKIIFRDEITSRKYRRRIEDIIKYILISKLDEENPLHTSASDLVLEIYAPTDDNKKTETCLVQDINGEPSGSIEKNKRKILNNIEPSPKAKRIRLRSEYQNNFNFPGKDIQNWKANVNNLQICLKNSVVKIGTYEYFKENKSVCISKECVTFFLPILENEKQLQWKIELNYIIKILIHYSETKQALFVFVSSSRADEIRCLLNMKKFYEPYFDPDSLDLRYQFISILPMKIDRECINIIKELCKSIEIIDIDLKICNDLMGVKNLTENNNEIPVQAFRNTGTNGKFVNFCRVIRIGTYEIAKNRLFSISLKKLTFCAPCLGDLLVKELSIKMDNIIKMEIGFSDISPVIFIYVNRAAGEMIRTKLCMKNHRDLRFYPISTNPTENKIIILPFNVFQENVVIQELIKRGKIKNLDEKTTITILRASLHWTALTESNKKSNDITTLNNNMKLYLKSNYLKIGAYKFNEKNVMVSLKGFHVRVPVLRESTSFENFDIQFSEIIEILYNLNQTNSVFIYATKNCYDRIKNLIRICDENIASNSLSSSNKSLDENRIVIIFNEIPLIDEIILVNLLNRIPSKEITANSVGQMLEDI